jgi:curved DNA-binding protein CbpA
MSENPTTKKLRTEPVGHYELLGVPSTATTAELQKRYRRLALEHHPDRNVGREEDVKAVFQRITEAYSTLMDPAKRDAYDSRSFINFSSRVSNFARSAREKQGASPSTSPARADDRGASGDGSAPTNDDGDDDTEDEYMPTYGGRTAHSHATQPVIADGLPSLQLVAFTLTRDVPGASLGLALDKSMKVRKYVEGSPADATRIPLNATVSVVNGVPVKSPADVAAAAGDATTVEVVALCSVQRVLVARRVLQPLHAELAPLLRTDPAADAFSLPHEAICRCVGDAASGVKLAPGETQPALTLAELGAAWAAVGGRRVLTISSRAAPGPIRPVGGGHDDAAEAHDVPSAIAERRHFVAFGVLRDSD